MNLSSSCTPSTNLPCSLREIEAQRPGLLSHLFATSGIDYKQFTIGSVQETDEEKLRLDTWCTETNKKKAGIGCDGDVDDELLSLPKDDPTAAALMEPGVAAKYSTVEFILPQSPSLANSWVIHVLDSFHIAGSTLWFRIAHGDSFHAPIYLRGDEILFNVTAAQELDLSRNKEATFHIVYVARNHHTRLNGAKAYTLLRQTLSRSEYSHNVGKGLVREIEQKNNVVSSPLHEWSDDDEPEENFGNRFMEIHFGRKNDPVDHFALHCDPSNRTLCASKEVTPFSWKTHTEVE